MCVRGSGSKWKTRANKHYRRVGDLCTNHDSWHLHTCRHDYTLPLLLLDKYNIAVVIRMCLTLAMLCIMFANARACCNCLNGREEDTTLDNNSSPLLLLLLLRSPNLLTLLLLLDKYYYNIAIVIRMCLTHAMLCITFANARTYCNCFGL